MSRPIPIGYAYTRSCRQTPLSGDLILYVAVDGQVPDEIMTRDQKKDIFNVEGPVICQVRYVCLRTEDFSQCVIVRLYRRE